MKTGSRACLALSPEPAPHLLTQRWGPASSFQRLTGKSGAAPRWPSCVSSATTARQLSCLQPLFSQVGATLLDFIQVGPCPGVPHGCLPPPAIGFTLDK